ncbi:MAG: 30S ribosomal protein S18 [Candidatus Caenarcaniphilales bacterium]|jgi:small subunit ribosomal protein S18|nr:30S ribosomal protein S18 [Candidatus Caenarcaniphilales bacterium]
MRRKIKNSPESVDINFKNVALLTSFTDSSNRILGRKQTGLDAKKQRLLQKAVKCARTLGLMPY